MRNRIPTLISHGTSKFDGHKEMALVRGKMIENGSVHCLTSSHLSFPPLSVLFCFLFCFVLWRRAPRAKQPACLPVARLTTERLVILLSCAAEKNRGERETQKESTREWERRGLGRGNGLIDLLCAKPGKH